MILAILSALICFITAVIMFTPYYRKLTLLRPCAVYFIFQGCWQLVAYLVSQLAPGNEIMLYINCIATIVLLIYYIFILLMTSRKSKRKNKKQQNSEEY